MNNKSVSRRKESTRPTNCRNLKAVGRKRTSSKAIGIEPENAEREN